MNCWQSSQHRDKQRSRNLIAIKVAAVVSAIFIKNLTVRPDLGGHGDGGDHGVTLNATSL